MSQLHKNEEDRCRAKMWVLVSQKICTPKTLGALSVETIF